MALLNYSTSIAVKKTIGEIQDILAQAGARAVMIEYDGAEIVNAVSFKINTPHGEMGFRLPANPDAVYRLLKTARRVPSRLKTIEQAHRVAWRVLKSWVQAQTAIIEIGMVKAEQVFLPYAVVNPETGQTLYEALESKGFKQLTMAPKD